MRSNLPGADGSQTIVAECGPGLGRQRSANGELVIGATSTTLSATAASKTNLNLAGEIFARNDSTVPALAVSQ